MYANFTIIAVWIIVAYIYADLTENAHFLRW